MIIPVCLAIGAGLPVLTFLLSIVFAVRGDTIDTRPGRHRAETAPGTAAQRHAHEGTIDLGLVAG